MLPSVSELGIPPSHTYNFQIQLSYYVYKSVYLHLNLEHVSLGQGWADFRLVEPTLGFVLKAKDPIDQPKSDEK